MDTQSQKLHFHTCHHEHNAKQSTQCTSCQSWPVRSIRH